GSLRSDWEAYKELNKNLGVQPHVMRGNFVWDLPDLQADGGAKRVVGYILNDWQISGIFGISSGNAYNLTFNYQSNGSSVDLTGSPSYGNNGNGARVVFLGDPGSGCSSNQYAQFNAALVTGPDRGSIGMESGRNAMRGCAQRDLDLSLSRNIRLGGGRAIQVRMDASNAFNIGNWNGRQAELQLTNPTDKGLRNAQLLADGSVNPDRTRPNNAGFGAVTGAGGMRTIRLTFRFSF